MIRPHPVYAALGTTIFEVMSRMAEEHGAINLGQGFPDETMPRALLEKAGEEILNGSNQYPSMLGTPTLRKAVAAHEARHWDLKRRFEDEVVVTSGATEALAASILAFVGEGDEVIVFEPLYDAYVPLIRRAGARAVPVRLAPPDWKLDTAALKRALTPKTRAILLNDPLNPAAKVYALSELEAIAALAEEADLLAIVDAVYERTTFDGRPHILGAPSRHDEPHTEDRLGGKDLLGDRLEGRLGDGADRAREARRQGAQFLTFATPPTSRPPSLTDGLIIGILGFPASRL
ncbi:MAG: aminotransferase class I/II-fold pyridoxal phosphate-dependent enzyme [Alphaproteobacteria bacterium]